MKDTKSEVDLDKKEEALINQAAETMSTNGSKLHNYSWRVKGLWFKSFEL